MKRLVFLLAMLGGCQCSAPEEARKSATAYMLNIPDATRVECADRDTNHDGYCSCTVFRGSAEPLPIECGCERFCIWNCARGCKYVPFAGGKGK